ncbi:hypothetical protein D3C87_1012540 [compost metagenome]
MFKIVMASVMPLVFTFAANAQELTPQGLFNRCYIQLTGNPVPLKHALMAQVVSGKLSAVAACKQVLRKGMLGSNGEITSRKDLEAQAVLNNFYSFHRTWFPSSNFDTVAGYTPVEHNGTLDLYDATEPALSLTYSMFGVNQKYADTLNRSVGIKAIRVEDAVVKTRIGWKGSNPARMFSNTVEMGSAPFSFRSLALTNTQVARNINKHDSIRTAVPTIQVGELVGIVPNTTSFIVPHISMKPSGDRLTDKGFLFPNLNYTYDLFKNHGGGVLGSTPYLLQYYGHSFNMQFNGQNKVARRWSQQNMESFLCASLPALRESDVQSFVSSSSSAAFRNSTSCVMCHATLDPMAYVTRNFTMGAFDIFRATQNGDVTRDGAGNQINPPPAFLRNAVAMTTYKATAASVNGWPAEPVAGFHTQTPTGRLYYRSATGALVDKQVTGITGMGRAMSETDDYYLCAAKRYFEFMTGIQVPLYDRTDPRNATLNTTLTPEAIEDRRYVEDLASSLRSSGSVVQMVEDILSSDYYSKENFR